MTADNDSGGGLARSGLAIASGTLASRITGFLRTVVPVSQIVFGTDYWYRTAEETGRGLTTNKVFNAEELRHIAEFFIS